MDRIDSDSTGFRNEILTRLNQQATEIAEVPLPRKRRRGNGLDCTAIALADDFLSRGREDRHPERASFLSALGYLQHGCSTSAAVYEASGRAATYAPSSPMANRQKMVIEKYHRIEEQSHYWESSRRLYMLRIVYEIDKLLVNVQRICTPAGRTETDIAAAERTFSELSEVPVARVRALRKRTRTYLEIAAHTNGLGFLLMLGTQSRDLYGESYTSAATYPLTKFSWEHRIPDTATASILQFCKQNMTRIVQAAERLQPIACEMLKTQFIECGVPPSELFEDGNLFSQHFRALPALQSHQCQTTSLQALAEVAADEMQARTMDTTGYQRSLTPVRRASPIPPDPQVGTSFEPRVTPALGEAERNPEVIPTFANIINADSRPSEVEHQTANAQAGLGEDLRSDGQTVLNSQRSPMLWAPEDLNDLMADLFGFGFGDFPNAIT